MIEQYQAEWLLRASDTRLPKWLRVVALALGTAGTDGRAPQHAGTLAAMLGRSEGGAVVPDPNASRSIKTAVELGFLADGSSTRLLILPGHLCRRKVRDR